MKFSEAMLKGFVRVDGRQCVHTFSAYEPGDKLSVCAMGAANLVLNGDPREAGFIDEHHRFAKEWGIHPKELNDEGMDWQEIYGMAVAAGL